MAEIIDNYILSTIKGSERKKYATTHGINSLINAYHGLPWNDKEAERVYKICNENCIGCIRISKKIKEDWNKVFEKFKKK